MKYTQELYLDVSNDSGFYCVRAKQGDRRTRYIKVTIIAGSEKLELDAATMSADFRCTKPDGTSVIDPGTINQDGTVTAELTEQVLAVAGLVRADIAVNAPGGGVLSTVSFVIQVEKAPLGKNIPSTNEFLTLYELIQKAQALIDNGGTVGAIALDKTLSIENMAADAKAVGDFIAQVENKIPTKTGDLTNNSGFITNAVSDLLNYYGKSETYTRDEINALVSAIPKFAIKVVSGLPTKEINETTIYLVPGGSNSNLYTEYIFVDGAWEVLGSQRVDLTGYAKEDWVVDKLGNYALAAAIPSWAKQTTKPSYTATEVGADSSGTAEAKVKNHNESDTSHQDIRQLISQLSSEIAGKTQLRPEKADSLEWLAENGDQSLVYVLPNGNLAMWLLTEREVSTGGGYTNLAKTFEESRLNSSGVLTATTGAWACKEYIGKLVNGDIVRIKGFGALGDYNCAWYRTNDGATSYSSFKATALEASPSEHISYAYDSQTGIVTMAKTSTDDGYSYVRFSGKLVGTTDDIIITVNEEIVESSTEIIREYAWAETGLTIVPGDYEPRILELEESVHDLEEDVLALKSQASTPGGSTTDTAAIPSYWESMVAEKTATVKALQEAGGKNCVTFTHAADLHIDDNEGGRTTDIGKVMAKTMDNCEIPFAVLDGDINTRASYSSEAKLLEAQAQIPVHLAPLWGTERLLVAPGNHDGCWGDSSGYYRHQFTPERMWQTFFRGQALDFRRVFSDDGLYFYVDNVAQKTRFIVLNSNFGGEYAEDENGWAVNNRFGTSCYGQAQLDWLADVALDMPEGYGAIICAHVPPNIAYTVDKAQFIGIINAYNGKSTFTGSYTAGVEGWSNSAVNVDFTAAKGEVIAMFAGHVHGDSIDTTTMSCPIITILSAGASPNDPYKDSAPTRTPGTDTETSFDVVTINRQTRTIYCTRVGAGEDREIGY